VLRKQKRIAALLSILQIRRSVFPSCIHSGHDVQYHAHSVPVHTHTTALQCRMFTTFTNLHLFILPLQQSETRITVLSGSHLLSEPQSYGLRAGRAKNKTFDFKNVPTEQVCSGMIQCIHRVQFINFRQLAVTYMICGLSVQLVHGSLCL